MLLQCAELIYYYSVYLFLMPSPKVPLGFKKEVRVLTQTEVDFFSVHSEEHDETVIEV